MASLSPRKRLVEIDERLSAIRTDVADIEAIEEPTDDDATRAETLTDEFVTLEAERAEVAAKVEKLDRIHALAQNPANREPGAYEAPNVVVRKDPFENLMALRSTAPDDEDVRARAITAVSETRQPGVTDAQRAAAVERIETVPGAAHHALLHGSPAYRSAFKEWGRAQGQNVMWTPEEQDAVRAALSLTGANGGFTLPTLLDPTLIQTGSVVKSPLRQISTVETISQNVWHGVTVGNVTAYWTAEAANFTEGNPGFASPLVTASKVTAYLPGSYELFEDSTLLSRLPGLAGEAIALLEDTAFISGTGSDQPHGVVHAISATVASTVTATTRGQFNAASSGDVYAVLNAVASRYEDNLTWVANKAYFNTINQMSPSGGGSLFWGDLREGVNRPLLGDPIVKSSVMSASTASGTIGMILGDFSRYLIVDRIGTQVEFVQNVFSSTSLPMGQRALVIHKRVGAEVLDINAFRFLKL